MKNILTILFVVALSVYGISQEENDLENQNLNGKVKSIASTTYRSSLIDGQIKLGDITYESLDEYNHDGYLTTNAYRFHTKILGKGAWKKRINTLNKKNQVTISSFTKDSVLVEKTTNTYRNDTLIQIAYSNEKGSLLANVMQSFNKEGLLSESKVFNSSGAEIEKTTFNYDRKGNIAITIKWKGEAMELLNKYTYTDNNTTTVLKTNGKGQWKSQVVEVRNANDQIIRLESRTKENKIKSKTVNEYDQFGNLTLRRIYGADGQEEEHNYMRYAYTFDENNNWIQKVEYLHNGNSLDVTKRTIVYY
jgi:hypothetical protein